MLSASHHIWGPAHRWLDRIEIRNPNTARMLCALIPDQCPFARDIEWCGHTVAHIPPLCKFNPLYEPLVALRFRALSYLVAQGYKQNPT